LLPPAGCQGRGGKKSQGRAKNIGRKTEDRVSPNRKTAKKQGKKNALKKKQLRLVQPKNLTPITIQLSELIAYR
jgi:hypothetical protein